MRSLQATYFDLVQRYSITGDALVMWKEIQSAYSDSSRHYHTLAHLENLHWHLEEIKFQIQNWDAVLLALFYHDIVYNVKKSDNEEKSASVAEKRLQSLSVPSVTIERCIRHILATKSHTISSDNDTNLFTDADLCILGISSEEYFQYCKKIRSEYSVYPDMLYKPGRKKVLQHFLAMDRIFKTEYFFVKFERQARENIGAELLQLS